MKSIYLALFVILIAACTKPTPPEVTKDKTKKNENYMPLSEGSEWVFGLKVNNVPIQDIKTVSTDRDTTIHGEVYHIFISDAEGLQYIRHDGAEYYNVLSASSLMTPIKMLDTTKAINEKWIGGKNGSDTYEYTIVAKYPTYTIDTYVHENVIEVKQERKDASNVVTLSSTSFFALGVGQVHSKGVLNSLPMELVLKKATIAE